MAYIDLDEHTGRTSDNDSAADKLGLDQNGRVPLQIQPAPGLFDAASEVQKIFGGSGIQAGESDIATLAAKNPEDRAKYIADLTAQRERRAAPTLSAGGRGGDADTNYDGRPDPGWVANAGGRSLVPINDPARAATTTSRQSLNMPGLQFSDPYTNLFEQTARQYLERLTGQNSELDRLMGLISQQIGELSGSPGYSPQEQAAVNTQALEPIERLRQQSQRNILQRASARGVLPSSGIIEDEAQEADRNYDQLRTVANRDLAINAINKRQADQARAIQLAQLGLDVPNQLGQQSLGVANQLYQLPRNAMMDSLQVLNASSPQSGIAPLIQLMQLQQQQAQFDSQQSQQFWQQIGANLPDLLDAMGL